MPVQTILIAALVLLCLVAARWAWVTFRWRGRYLVTCPENQKPAGVRIDTAHASKTALWKGAELRLSTCSRWPERSGCGQECLHHIEASPADCLVRNILVTWYHGKACVNCGQTFADIEWSRKPALRMPEGTSREWEQVPAEELPEILKTAAPLCFACHMANTLVREHPELVVDRSAGVK